MHLDNIAAGLLHHAKQNCHPGGSHPDMTPWRLTQKPQVRRMASVEADCNTQQWAFFVQYGFRTAQRGLQQSLFPEVPSSAEISTTWC